VPSDYNHEKFIGLWIPKDKVKKKMYLI